MRLILTLAVLGLTACEQNTPKLRQAEQKQVPPSTPDPLRSSVVVTNSPCVADGMDWVLVSVNALDSSGMPVAGAVTTVTVSGAGNILKVISAATDERGMAEFELRSTKAEAKTIAAELNSSGSKFTLSAQALFFAGPATTVSWTMSALETGVSATAGVVALVTVHDAFGNPVSHVKAVPASDFASLIPAEAALDAQGQAQFFVLSTRAGTDLLRLAAGEAQLPETQPISFIHGPATAATSTLSMNRTKTGATGVSKIQVTLAVKDEFGNDVPAQAVSATASGDAVVLVPSQSLTNADGLAIFDVSSTVIGTKSVVVDLPGGSMSVHPEFVLSWQRNQGPLYGSIERLRRRDDGTIYACGKLGMFESNDEGLSWRQITSNNLGGIDCAIDPVDRNRYYLLTRSTGLGTEDNGAHWISKDPGLASYYTRRALEVVPGAPSTVFMTLDDGIYKSTDWGDHWSAIAGTVTSAYFVVPTRETNWSTQTVFTRGPVIFKSTIAGGSWNAAGTSPPPSTGLWLDANNAPVFESNNQLFVLPGGQSTWTPYKGLSAAPDRPVTFDTTPPCDDTIGTPSGPFALKPFATSWSAMGTGLSGVSIKSIISVANAFSCKTFAAAGDRGVWRTGDGEIWTNLHRGLGDGNVADVIRLATSPPRVIVATTSGVFISDDDEHYVRTNFDSLGAERSASSLAYHSATDLVLVGRDAFPQGAAVSVDHGTTWSDASTGLNPAKKYVWKIKTHPRLPLAYASTNDGLYVTSLPEISWAKVPGGPVGASLVFDTPAVGNITVTGTGINRSDDDGATWYPMGGTGLTSNNLGAMAIHPTKPEVWFLNAGNEGLFKSSNYGSTWQGVPGPTGPFVLEPTFDQSGSLYLAAGQFLRYRLYKSDDEGASWRELDHGTPPTYDLNGNGIVYYSPVGDKLYYFGANLYRSDTLGE